MNEKWVRDTGLIFALLGLFFSYRGFAWGLPVAAVLLLAVLFVPKALWPLAWVWERIAHGLGFVMQGVFFGLVFFAVITPVALVRRIFVRDPLVLYSGAEKDTAFVSHAGGIVRREHLEKPY